MIQYALNFAFGCFGFALLFNLWRIFRAPGVITRVLALDTMVINVIAILVLYGISTHSGVYFEAALLFAMTGFVSTVAYCKFVLRGDIIE
ncbi:K+/H+ antiporter subunit F [Pseudorhodobacter sp.]|uniref:K+/H+ antiporter subunit F n=1 Tax=Pseudorhodobacter sp. TaxID=1934400 RepID=UPI0026476914|nr:K+/H+ antiporter subunit F [Pseudorhodobacter sp.]MDN5787679.1 K+/H+ antiporter subunit F [Pseudorhodobacter sp.]